MAPSGGYCENEMRQVSQHSLGLGPMWKGYRQFSPCQVGLVSQLLRVWKRKSEGPVEGGQDCVAQRNLLDGRDLSPSKASSWQGPSIFWGGHLCAPFCLLPPCPSRCGSTPRFGRASSSAANAPSPRASRSSYSCHPSSWVRSLTSVQSSGSPCWPMSAPSPPIRYPKVWGGWPHGSSPGRLAGGGQRGALQYQRV